MEIVPLLKLCVECGGRCRVMVVLAALSARRGTAEL
jgi:hypothetical protein